MIEGIIMGSVIGYILAGAVLTIWVLIVQPAYWLFRKFLESRRR